MLNASCKLMMRSQRAYLLHMLPEAHVWSLLVRPQMRPCLIACRRMLAVSGTILQHENLESCWELQSNVMVRHFHLLPQLCSRNVPPQHVLRPLDTLAPRRMPCPGQRKSVSLHRSVQRNAMSLYTL